MVVGFTHGDVNGIGYELIMKLMAENKICELCTPLLFGSSKVAAYHRKALDIENLNLNSIQKAQEVNAKRCNIINCVDDNIKVDLGSETSESDEAAMIALQKALTALDRNEIDVLVAAPQGLRSLPEGDWTSFLAKRYEVKQIMPLLVGTKMKMAFVTHHIPLKEVDEQITFNNIFYKLKMLDSCLKRDFVIRKPRIAVLALNPHGGELGMCGSEEKNIISPAIEKARSSGIMVLGPYSSETLFADLAFEQFDAVLAMYHEQGMLPFKALEGHGGAVLMAGLPVVCTTTVHGMAYDITGQGKADDAGMRSAFYLAMDVYRNRKMQAEISANPLKHYDISSNGNEADLNVEQIAGVEQDLE